MDMLKCWYAMRSSLLGIGKVIQELDYVPGPDDIIQMDLNIAAAPRSKFIVMDMVTFC